jgi:pimeloyl-ACP methyl ester carboxylesterase
MGGFVGMRLATRKPHLIKSLTLMETSADGEVNKLKYGVLNIIFKVAGSKPIYKKIMNILFGKTFMSDPERAEERLYWERNMMTLPKTVTRAVSGVISRRDVFEEIKSIQKPTLIIVGDEDVATTPEKAQRIHKQINGSVLEIISGAGHSSTIEKPDEVNGILEKFLSHVKGDGSHATPTEK